MIIRADLLSQPCRYLGNELRFISFMQFFFFFFVTRQKWGRADCLRYDCCFIWVDAALPVLDRFVDQRVDCMIAGGLLNEVHEIYKPNADYTRGLRQAIGVREFEDFFRYYFSNTMTGGTCVCGNGSAYNSEDGTPSSINEYEEVLEPNFLEILNSNDNNLKVLLCESIDKLKANTRKLVRRQVSIL